MKNIWKWILGIVILLVILAVPFVLHYTLGMNFTRGFGGPGPMMHDFGWDGRGMGRGFEGNGPIGMHRGFGFFGPFMLFGGLVKLVFFGALLYGAYLLGKRNARVTLDPMPSVPSPEPPPAPQGGRKVAKSG